eukprot:TRINITY_DN2364_c0_g1_i7.p1 TRINITY_DN2364_c0_g1~~TRINITY_DN2364_c0_g1_i7.p1  ORF type:complete len:1084 (-),score=222.84 TRINITY_DN2364_c0_g1_i7:1503-4361(-)
MSSDFSREAGQRPALILQVQVLDAENYPRRFLCAVSGTALTIGLERAESAAEGMADSGTLGGAILGALKRISLTGHVYPYAWTTLGAEVSRLGGLWLAAGLITPAEARVIGVDAVPLPPPRRVVPQAPVPPVVASQPWAPPAADAVKWSDAGDLAGCVPCAAARLGRHVRALGAFGYHVAVGRPLAGGAGVGSASGTTSAAGATSTAGSRLLVGMRLDEVDITPAILRAWGLDVEHVDVEGASAGGVDDAVIDNVEDAPANAGQNADTEDEGASDGLPVNDDNASSGSSVGNNASPGPADRVASVPGDYDTQGAQVPDGTGSLPEPLLRRRASAAAAASPVDDRGASAAAEIDGGTLPAAGFNDAGSSIAPAAPSPGASNGRAGSSAAHAATAPGGPKGAGATISAEADAAARSSTSPFLVVDISIDGLYPLAPDGGDAATPSSAAAVTSAASSRTVAATASVHVAKWPSIVRRWSDGHPTAVHFEPLSAVQDALAQFLRNGTTSGPLALPTSVSPSEVAAATTVLPLRLLHIAASRLARTSTACAVCQQEVVERTEHFGSSRAVCLGGGGVCAAAARGSTALAGWERRPVQPSAANGAPDGGTGVADGIIAVPPAAMDRLAVDLLRHPNTVDLLLYLAGQAAISSHGERLDPSPPFLPTMMAKAVDTGGGVGSRRSTTLRLAPEGLNTFLDALYAMPPVANLADAARTGGTRSLAVVLNHAHPAAAAVAAWVVGSMPGVLRVAAADEPPFVLAPPQADEQQTPVSSLAAAAGPAATTEQAAPQDAAGATAAEAEQLPQTFLVGGGEATGEWAFQAAVTAAVAAGHSGVGRIRRSSSRAEMGGGEPYDTAGGAGEFYGRHGGGGRRCESGGPARWLFGQRSAASDGRQRCPSTDVRRASCAGGEWCRAFRRCRAVGEHSTAAPARRGSRHAHHLRLPRVGRGQLAQHFAQRP